MPEVQEAEPPGGFQGGALTFARRAALLAGLGGLLAGCGFQPVYAPSTNGAGPSEGLAEIEVQPIAERPGQELREALLGRFRTEPGAPRRFDLQVNFWVSGDALGVLNFTQATRVRLVGQSTWVLTSRDTKKTKLAEGSERVIDGFDIFDSQYFAMDLDNEKVQRRMAEAMADRIAQRLAMWFHQHPTAVG